MRNQSRSTSQLWPQSKTTKATTTQLLITINKELDLVDMVDLVEVLCNQAKVAKWWALKALEDLVEDVQCQCQVKVTKWWVPKDQGQWHQSVKEEWQHKKIVKWWDQQSWDLQCLNRWNSNNNQVNHKEEYYLLCINSLDLEVDQL